MPKLRLQLDNIEVDRLSSHSPESGLGFYVLKSRWGLTACNNTGWALPLERSDAFFDAFDLVARVAIPSEVQTECSDYTNVGEDQAMLATMMSGLTLPPGYAGSVGALPLISSSTLMHPTRFIRLLSGTIDLRYVGGLLKAGTYLTTMLDHSYANSGFSAVGRYALPLPLPASLQVQYEIPMGTDIRIGTIAPMFGQAGGGVEINLVLDTPAVSVFTTMLPDF